MVVFTQVCDEVANKQYGSLDNQWRDSNLWTLSVAGTVSTSNKDNIKWEMMA